MAPKSRLRTTRSALRQQITKKCNKVGSSIESLSEVELEEYLHSLTEIKQKVDDVNERVLDELWDGLSSEDDADKLVCEEMDSCVEYNDCLNRTILLLKSRLSSLPSTKSDQPHNVNSHLKLPELPLPCFGNREGENISKFFREFEAVVGRYNLSTYLKFTLLTKQLNGDPAKLVDSLETSKRSYEDAKELLQEAFADTLTQQYNVIKQLSELKLTYESDPYEFISNMRIIINQFEALEINHKLVLQFFIWNGLNECFKNQPIHITGFNKPSLDEINKNIFVALERYQNISKKYSDKKRDKKDSVKRNNCFASSVCTKSTNSFNKCCLCLADGINDIEHTISKCNQYNSPKSKLEKLGSISHCTKCTYPGHKPLDCRFKFRRKCDYCSKWHFSFLCQSRTLCKENMNGVKSDNNANSKAKDSKPDGVHKQASSSIVWSESGTLQISCNPVTAMPTFSLNDAGDRAVKDSGSQITFVEENWVKSQNFEVIDRNYSLILNGINCSKPLVTSVYRVALGKEVFPAVAIPSININLNLPGIADVARIFRDKGYELADKTLYLCRDQVYEIRLLLGNDNAHVVPQTDVLFGGQPPFSPSVYLTSPLGVMLVGDIERYKVNLKALPNRHFQPASYASSAEIVSFEKNDSVPNSKVVEVDGDHEISNLPVNANIAVLNDNGQIVEKELQRATSDILSSSNKAFLDSDSDCCNESTIEENDKLVEFALENTTRDSDGRLIMPLLWNGKVAHLLGKNQNLSKVILKSNFKKYNKQEDALMMIDAAFKEQEKLGIIERIDDLKNFLEDNPQHSFLPHMPVFKMDRDTTKCRNVFLSNLCESDSKMPMVVSHNQVIFAGPCLNRKISTSILQLRFDEKLLCFDLKKAFLMIKLTPVDQSKLLFYWYRNVAKKDFSLVAYKNCRLPFGLTCSPTLLMLALYKILLLDTDYDSSEMVKLKKDIYNLAYMDNLACSANDSSSLKWAYSKLEDIFSPYQFGLQQFVTNDLELQREIDGASEATPSKVKLLGIRWNRDDDTISTQKLFLDCSANTKRTILSSLASNFDVYSFNSPLLNRARLFMHRLQCMKDIAWDDRLSSDLLREWMNITKQVNNAPPIVIKRCVGRRDDSFELIAFCDASKDIYGTVLYIRNLRTNEVNFLLSRNKIVGHKLESKSIPSLELQSICFGTETLIDTYNELSGVSGVVPIHIVKLELYSDSAVALNWLNAQVNKFDKMRKRSVFVMNRLHHIERLCETFPVKYNFCAGMNNPADCITRPLSYRQLMKTNFCSGPDLLGESLGGEVFDIIIPNPLTNISPISEGHCEVSGANDAVTRGDFPFHLDTDRGLHHMLSVCKLILTFINNIKFRMKQKEANRYAHFYILGDEEISQKAYHLAIMKDQKQHFNEVFRYFQNKSAASDMPNIVGQLNLFIDSYGLIRVKSKFSSWKDRMEYPILLAKDSKLTVEIIMQYHKKLAHSGIYSTLTEIRKKFWIPCHFSTIKNVLKMCIHCRRFNGRTIKLNQSPYREFRISPPTIPYRYVFADFFGPYSVYWEGKKIKAWILCITCLWSRAINLKVCVDLTTQSFLRAFQLHCFEFGVPELCLSDQGSQLIAGGKVIENFLHDKDVKTYLTENNIKPLSFQQYYKGHNELGSLVEICVKMTKRLIDGSIRNLCLKYLEFEFIVCNTVHLVNRRPIAFKEYLRENDANEFIPSPITPEILLKGHELNSLDLIPQLHPLPQADPDWVPNVSHVSHVQDSYGKLRKVRESLTEIYNNEFLTQLISQATDRKSRYKPVSHKSLEVGDIVLIKEPLAKPTNFPMGIVKEIQVNSLGEVTGATLLKGKSREITKRHVTSLIPFLYQREYEVGNPLPKEQSTTTKTKTENIHNKPKRKAAVVSQQRTQELINNDSV